MMLTTGSLTASYRKVGNGRYKLCENDSPYASAVQATHAAPKRSQQVPHKPSP